MTAGAKYDANGWFSKVMRTPKPHRPYMGGRKPIHGIMISHRQRGKTQNFSKLSLSSQSPSLYRAHHASPYPAAAAAHDGSNARSGAPQSTKSPVNTPKCRCASSLINKNMFNCRQQNNLLGHHYLLSGLGNASAVDDTAGRAIQQFSSANTPQQKLLCVFNIGRMFPHEPQ